MTDRDPGRFRPLPRPLRVVSAAALALGLLTAVGPATAGTLFVDSALGTPYQQIQDAIDDAVDGDVIVVFNGTYGPIDFLGKSLRVVGDGGAAVTTIDAAGSGPAVIFDGVEPPEALLQGFTITGGTGLVDASSGDVVGGGIFVRRGGRPRISGNIITGNTAEFGAGIGVAAAAPHIYGNTIEANTAAAQGGGFWIQDADSTVADPTVFSCNLVRDNSGVGSGGAWLGASIVHATNNRFIGNVGERGGLWVTTQATGFWDNNTFAANEGAVGGAGGLENNSPSVDFVNNVITFNTPGWGAIRDASASIWAYNNVFGNADGDYAGSGGDPTGTSGNIVVDPLFTTFTAGNAYDDDLTLLPTSVLVDFGEPTGDYLDLDGTRSDMGFSGGPHTDCDADGDGVRVSDTPPDCFPDEAAFYPGAYEPPTGLDHNCDGFGTHSVVTLVSGDGGLAATGDFEYGLPTAVPGVGHLGASVWCTDCPGFAGPGVVSSLTAPLDSTIVTTAGVATRVSFFLAYDDVAGVDGGLFEVDDPVTGWTQQVPDGGYPVASLAAANPLSADASLGAWSGDGAEWDRVTVDTTAWTGLSVDMRWRYAAVGAASPGWSVATIAVQVEDADGDGRAADLTDCDDTSLFVYDGAPEIPYDGVDQDCDGSDLEDVDGDGVVAVQAGGDDCDDNDPLTFPGGVEIPYDGQDQDCSGADLDDLDEDGAAGGPGGDDCNDDDPAIGPFAEDIPYDGIDQDCRDGDLVDVDRDGFDGDRPPPFGDCDDDDATVNPGAPEICNDAVDNDCDERIDLLDDLDLDGWDECSGDCDETRPDVNPGQVEVCDTVDTDCDGIIPGDEVDADEDGAYACGGDCDDLNPVVAEGFPEVCDGVDNDCDRFVDEDHDRDLDGYSSCTSDCDDLRSVVYPGAPLDCTGGGDYDCDGVPDLQQPACVPTDGGGCISSMAAAPSPRGAAGRLLALFVLAGVYRSRRTQAAPGRAAPEPTSPGPSPSAGTQAR